MKIKNDFTLMEMMIFFWDSVADREKVSDEYFDSIAEREEMRVLYNEEFTKRSVSKVLSAISNRERLNDRTKLESKFWNHNMRLLEDAGMREALIAPIKRLSFADLEQNQSADKTITCVFIPGHENEYYIEGDTVYINFFRLYNDFNDPENILFDGRPFMERVTEILEKAY